MIARRQSALPARAALDAAFNAASVAVVGASADPTKLGHLVLRMLLESGYDGQVYPINRGGAPILGRASFARLSEVEAPVEVAVVIVPSDQLIATLEECAAKEVRLVAAITSGFAEAGDAGQALQEQLDAALATAPYRLLGPNCEGYVAPASKTFVTFSMMTLGLADGPVGIVAQSGAISGTMAHRLNKMGVGIRALVSTGNEADLTATDALEWFAEDPTTRVVLGYIEEIRDAPRFIAAARAMRGKKPIVIEKPGRGQASRAAMTTHTGAIAGDDRVADGVFEELGIVRAHDLTTAIDAAAALSLGKRLAGRGIAVVSIAGGLAVEAADLIEAAGFVVPAFGTEAQRQMRGALPYFAGVRNPVDLTGAALANPGLFRQAIEIALADDNIHGLVVVVTFSPQAALAEMLMTLARSTEKPLLVVWTAPPELSPAPLAAFRDRRFPVFDAPTRAVTGLSAIARFSGLL